VLSKKNLILPPIQKSCVTLGHFILIDMIMSKKILIAILMLTATLSVSGQVRLGIRGGITLGELRFDRDVVNSDNRVGYTAGLLVDLNIPVVGLGIEASAMYTHRNNRLTDDTRVFKRHYIDIPVYARYRLSLPRVERVFAPYAFTGPCFSVLFDENGSDYYKSSKTCVSWDAGLGFDLFNHLRLSASYGLGLSRAMKYIDREYNGEVVHGKDSHWTINAAWLF
jgi:hypothetical protein